MQIDVHLIRGGPEERLAAAIEYAVFEKEMGLSLSRLNCGSTGLTCRLIARDRQTGEPVGTMRVVETTGNDELYRLYGLRAVADTKTARYTRLAVLPEYRGIDIPLTMMVEARRNVIVPNGFRHTWLLFNADRASSSAISKVLAYRAGSRTFECGYGVCRTLVRDEASDTARSANEFAELYLRSRQLPASSLQLHLPLTDSTNEWAAQ